MIVVEGKSAFGGIAMGKIHEITRKKHIVKRVQVEDVQSELHRFEKARLSASKELQVLFEKAAEEMGEENASIFEAYQMMLSDEDYLDSIRNIIETESVNAEFAVEITEENFYAIFDGMNDAYLKARAADVKDVSRRLIRVLLGQKELDEHYEEPFIVVADDLVPSDTALLDRKKVLAFVTRKGSLYSHTAILARTMNIPVLICTPVEENVEGRLAIIDGNQGIMVLDPDEQVQLRCQQLFKKEKEKKELLSRLKGVPSITPSGKEIHIYANAGEAEDVDEALNNDAQGIGLFRSEFLYLQRDHYPSEEEQFEVYKQVAVKMKDKPVTIRTLDIGADKQIDYFHLEEEENPALGYRAVRICLKRTELFKTQLRAIYRAAAFGRVSIMIPMVTSLWEVQKVKELAEEVKTELCQQNKDFAEPELGIMIETPAAVMMAEELAKEVDFFSIGTNDLTQYTLAIDRQNAKLDEFYDAHHPAVLKMIKSVVQAAHEAGILVGICGELGADLTMTDLFLEMGVDELSVSPAMVLPVRDKVLHSRV